MSRVVTVFRTVTYAIAIDLEEEGLENDATDTQVIDVALEYDEASWDELDAEAYVEDSPAGPLVTSEDADDDSWDASDEFPLDDDSEDLPEFPESEDDGF